VPEGALTCTSTHLVHRRDQGNYGKSAGWNGVLLYVRIVEVAGSSPVTSTKKSQVRRAYSLLADSVPVSRTRCVREAPKNCVSSNSAAALSPALVACA